MIEKNTFTPELLNYCVKKGLREPKPIEQLRINSNQLSKGRMLITPIQGAFLSLLVKIARAKNILEIGTFTGYSAAWMGVSLPNDGCLTTIDIDHTHLELARDCWLQLGIDKQIKPLKISASEYMSTSQEIFDIVFIDANKSQYIEYYEKALTLVKLHGLIIIDNVLMYGQILHENPDKKYLKTLQRLNDIIVTDERVELCMLPIGDGLTIARKLIG